MMNFLCLYRLKNEFSIIYNYTKFKNTTTIKNKNPSKYPFKLQKKRVFTYSKGQVMPKLTSIDDNEIHLHRMTFFDDYGVF